MPAAINGQAKNNIDEMSPQPQANIRRARRPSKQKQAKLDSELCAAAMEGDEARMAELLKAGADPDANNRHALGMSAKKGQACSVRMLLAASKIEAGCHEALMWASVGGKAACVELLRAKKYAPVDLAVCLQAAAAMGHKDCVFELVELVESHVKLAALGLAAGNGAAEVVALFLSMGIGSEHASLIELMARAKEGGHGATVEVIGAFLEGVELTGIVSRAAACGSSAARL